jgi:hypothetical protein
VSTQQTVGACDDRLRSLRHANIDSIQARDYPPPQAEWEALWPKMGELKLSWDVLLVADAHGSEEVFWVPPGTEAFAIWNLMRMLAGLHG